MDEEKQIDKVDKKEGGLKQKKVQTQTKGSKIWVVIVLVVTVLACAVFYFASGLKSESSQRTAPKENVFGSKVYQF